MGQHPTIKTLTNIHTESNKPRQLSRDEILLLNKLCRNFTFSELFKGRTVNKSPEPVLSNASITAAATFQKGTWLIYAISDA